MFQICERCKDQPPLSSLPSIPTSKDTKQELLTHAKIGINPQISSHSSKILIARLPILKALGANSNYLINWKKVVHQVFKLIKVSHALTWVASNLCTSTWDEDNNLVCTVLVQIGEKSNLCHLANKDNTTKIWDNLSCTQQDSTTRGSIHWINKLLNA